MKSFVPRRWAIAGGLLGMLLGLVSFAPASWLAQALASATGNHVLLTDARGTVWSGSGVLVLTGGDGSRDATSLPGRVSWKTGLQAGGVRLLAQQACCLNGELELLIQPGLGRLAISVANRSDWLVRVPAGWLAGLGTPWNTLQLGGSVRLQSHDLRFERVEGRWLQQGSAQLDLVNLSSRVSTLAPLGSYRFTVTADAANAGTSLLQLSTLDGGLLLTGQGQLSANGKSRFQGEASAAPGREEALNNLLNIIGRRQGPRSILTLG